MNEMETGETGIKPVSEKPHQTMVGDVLTCFTGFVSIPKLLEKYSYPYMGEHIAYAPHRAMQKTGKTGGD